MHQPYLEATDSRLDRLVTSAEPRQVATGFVFTEGPVWDGHGQWLTFNDIPADRMLRWDPRDGVRVVREPNNMGNGMTDGPDGGLLVCEHATSRLVHIDGQRATVIAERFGGRELNSPNDVIVSSSGVIVFTDPYYGRTGFVGVPRQPELAFTGVYALRLDAGQPPPEPTLLTADMGSPNGLCLSPDERFLYVADTEQFEIRRYRFHDDHLSDGTVWARTLGGEADGPDGLRVDELGNVYCAGPGGIHVFAASGEPLGRIRFPEVVANLTWGGPDGRTLFVCASTSVYALTTTVTSGRRQ
ncbi:SMP-30/gluconolactonase/LRE family protein [Mycobacterium sp. smrl_JER01]|uniref:SMP-30/gluconolactonase/LRE family protein n=1 Tax=Mycobacterium sp. smrl_JER01 TaxID=3402633 RepID=UPI003AC3C386